MKFTNPYWSNKLRISALQRWILLHSILYYELDESIVSDVEFDKHAKWLVQMQHDFPDDAEESDYYYVFHDFDGSTGFDLYGRLKKRDVRFLTHIANHVLKLYKTEKGAKHVSHSGRR